MAVDLVHAFGLPPEKAMEYFRSKGLRETWDWREMWQDAHARAFTVAKATKGGVLESLRGAVDKAIAEGQTLDQFKAGIAPTLKTLGWWGRVPDKNDPTRTVQLGSPWRLRTIYQTNIATAESAGRWRAFEDNFDDRPYLQYVAVLDQNTRASHAALHGKVFRADDPFWDSFMPPNDWGCRCRVRALSAAEVKERGLKVEDGTASLSLENVSINDNTGEGRLVGVYKNGKTRVVTGKGWNQNPGKRPTASLNAWESIKGASTDVRDQVMRDIGSDERLVAARGLRAKAFEEKSRLTKATGIASSDTIELGWMAPEEFALLERDGDPLANPLILTNRRRGKHGTRADKDSAVRELELIPGLLAKAATVLEDVTDGSLLYLYESAQKGYAGKVVVSRGLRVKGVPFPVNMFTTTGEVPIADLKGPQYRLIRGAL